MRDECGDILNKIYTTRLKPELYDKHIMQCEMYAGCNDKSSQSSSNFQRRTGLSRYGNVSVRIKKLQHVTMK